MSIITLSLPSLVLSLLHLWFNSLNHSFCIVQSREIWILFNKETNLLIPMFWLLLFFGLMHYQLWSKLCWCFLPNHFLCTLLNYQENEFFFCIDRLFTSHETIYMILRYSCDKIHREFLHCWYHSWFTIFKCLAFKLLLWVKIWNSSAKTSSKPRFARLHWIITDP